MVRIVLSEPERTVLAAAITEWSGPAMCTDELAVAMGFVDTSDFDGERGRLLAAVRREGDLSLRDWARILVLTEFVFVSDVFGSGYEWSLTTGLDDGETLRTLRGLQRKLTMAGAGRSQFRRPAG